MLSREIKNARKSLKQTETVISDVSGRVFREFRDEDGKYTSFQLNTRTSGFVVDTKPNFTVSCVLPWLFFGAQDVTCVANILKQHDINLILSLGVPGDNSSEIPNVFLTCYDDPNFNISALFKECIEIIEKTRISSKRIYIHCNAGVSRSATIVAAYVMFYFKIDSEKAVQLVKTKRASINPNSGFLKQLKEFENNC